MQNFNEIGRGLQGTIFEEIDRAEAFKQEHLANAVLPTNLKHEFSTHRSVVSTFYDYNISHSSRIHVPRSFEIFFETSERFWKENIRRFPVCYQFPGTVMLIEKILPLPDVIRRELVSRFHPDRNTAQLGPTAIDSLLEEYRNKNCLAGIYLGRTRTEKSAKAFSLRNFSLYLDDLALPVQELAAQMGTAYAIMHWGAAINGDDVEFVLSKKHSDLNDDGLVTFQQRSVDVFLLNFGQCSEVDLLRDPEYVYQQFKGAMFTGDNQLFLSPTVSATRSCLWPSATHISWLERLF